MMKMLSRFWILLALVMEIHPKCIHDLIAAPQISSSFHLQVYKEEERNKRAKDDSNEPHFQPIRVHVEYHQVNELDSTMKAGLKNIVAKAVAKMDKILSVIPIQGSLLLKRVEACPVVIRSGINKGKCARMKKGYRGESCLEILQIPDDHLEGLSLYNATYNKPLEEVFLFGTGVNNTDLILYVTALTTKLCLAYNETVTAYASHCQVDHSGRPVAGLINFCPFALKKFWTREHFLYQIALHELLHVLGFSNKLFSHYQHCTGTVCQVYTDPVRSVDGVMRLVTYNVVNYTQHHFGCFSEPEFGAPLEAASYGSLKVASHWDSRRMHTSLMTALIDQSQLVLDPITLSVFQDTGWYQVDFQHADRMMWGRGAGCTFGSEDECLEDPVHFCSNNSSGCHYLRYDKAVCDSSKTNNKCGVYTAFLQGSCVEDMPDKSSDLEIFSSSSRCVLSSISKVEQSTEKKGQCYRHRCLSDGSVEIQMNAVTGSFVTGAI
ncbi:leishmanolysin-like peptidase isoform X2 [Pomacea canaliculata]|nr:leishmanolysin-like peptidase isoform X2 [Pomacea canaliculata]